MTNMKVIKYLSLLISAFVGIVIGQYLAPAKPLYPYVPTDLEYELITNTEIQIIFIVGFFALIFTSIINIFYKSSHFLVILVVILAGILFRLIEAIRTGEVVPEFHFTYIISFLFGVLAGYGLVSIFIAIYNSD